MHEELKSGHLGFEKTYHTIQQHYFWTGMYSEIRKWCASCVDCTTKKTPCNLPKAPLQPIPVEGPCDRVAVDVLGLFQIKAINTLWYSLIISLNGLKHLPLRVQTH